ncbi:MAG TPA: response regulator [Gemmatimonadaceae bacterium]|nr:response regulator [Gemmatimonadaceae bacterium]
MTYATQVSVILVEHDANARDMAHRALADQAFYVIEASTAAEGLELVASETGPIDLLIANVEIPGGGVRAMAAQIKRMKPGLRILFTSNRNDAELLGSGFDIGYDPLLSKPFSGVELVESVCSTLRLETGSREISKAGLS